MTTGATMAATKSWPPEAVAAMRCRVEEDGFWGQVAWTDAELVALLDDPDCALDDRLALHALTVRWWLKHPHGRLPLVYELVWAAMLVQDEERGRLAAIRSRLAAERKAILEGRDAMTTEHDTELAAIRERRRRYSAIRAAIRDDLERAAAPGALTEHEARRLEAVIGEPLARPEGGDAA